MKGFTVLGHRGAMGHAPENTMPSFYKAIELKATMFELDIHMSRDGELVVIHDAIVDRTTSGTGKVSEMTWDEIRQLDAGSWFGPEFRKVRVPRLEDVFDEVGDRIQINVEIKAGDELYEAIVEKLARLIKEKDLAEQVVISSFHPQYLIEARSLLPEIQIGLIYSKPREDAVGEAVAAGWQALHPHVSQVTKELVDKAHSRGLIVRAWNPNEIEPMRMMIEAGVDGVGTDYPDRLRALAEEMRVL